MTCSAIDQTGNCNIIIHIPSNCITTIMNDTSLLIGLKMKRNAFHKTATVNKS